MTKRGKSGFSLIELIVVIAVMAVIAAVIVPSISGTREAAEEQAARAAAGALNLAQVQYRLENGTAAWSAAGNEARYGLIQPYMEYNESWAAFCARYPNFTFTFQGLDANGKMQKVVLTRTAAGTTVNY
jgi:prepilin-type N-terminal cleavage/methylation domain-containing protein